MEDLDITQVETYKRVCSPLFQCGILLLEDCLFDTTGNVHSAAVPVSNDPLKLNAEVNQLRDVVKEKEQVIANNGQSSCEKRNASTSCSITFCFCANTSWAPKRTDPSHRSMRPTWSSC